MPVTHKGYDPKLTEEYCGGSTGFVVGLGTSSEPDFVRLFQEEHGRSPSDQEVHDMWMRWSSEQRSASASENEADGPDLGAKRVARWRHQNEQMLEQAKKS